MLEHLRKKKKMPCHPWRPKGQNSQGSTPISGAGDGAPPFSAGETGAPTRLPLVLARSPWRCDSASQKHRNGQRNGQKSDQLSQSICQMLVNVVQLLDFQTQSRSGDFENGVCGHFRIHCTPMRQRNLVSGHRLCTCCCIGVHGT